LKHPKKALGGVTFTSNDPTPEVLQRENRLSISTFAGIVSARNWRQ
jgi:hypothetical protein